MWYRAAPSAQCPPVPAQEFERPRLLPAGRKEPASTFSCLPPESEASPLTVDQDLSGYKQLTVHGEPAEVRGVGGGRTDGSEVEKVRQDTTGVGGNTGPSITLAFAR